MLQEVLANGGINISFNQVGIGPDFAGTIVAVDGINYTRLQLPISFTWELNSIHIFAFQSPLIIGANSKQYVWKSTTGLSNQQDDSITATVCGCIVGNYKTQYYLTVKTNPAEVSMLNTAAVSGQGWYDSGTTATVDAVQDVDKISGQSRYDFRSWTRAIPTGVGNKATVPIYCPRTVTANYLPQYSLTVVTDPPGLLPQPTRNPPGQSAPANSWWYDALTMVTLTAQTVPSYVFTLWDINGTSQGSLVNPIIVVMSAHFLVTAHYVQAPSVTISPVFSKIKIGESVTYTSSVSGGSAPYSFQWYLEGTAVSGATSSSWTFAPATSQPIGNYTVYVVITDSFMYSAQSNSATVSVAPPLTVQVLPTSVSMLVGQTVTFMAVNSSGGYPPYNYQWYLDQNPVSGAISDTWSFTPAAIGIYYVYVKISDATNNIAHSDSARIVVSSVPVGGYSISQQKETSSSKETPYFTLVALFGAVLILKKRFQKIIQGHESIKLKHDHT